VIRPGIGRNRAHCVAVKNLGGEYNEKTFSRLTKLMNRYIIFVVVPGANQEFWSDRTTFLEKTHFTP
jgi:hypothetical protein